VKHLIPSAVNGTVCSDTDNAWLYATTWALTHPSHLPLCSHVNQLLQVLDAGAAADVADTKPPSPRTARRNSFQHFDHLMVSDAMDEVSVPGCICCTQRFIY
jgi:hypothetical protein